jgi:transcriptional regulator with XRE-family HTH domain
MASLQKQFGDRLRELRKARGWSQEHFADVCHVHRSHMGQIERGEVDVELSTLKKVAKGLGMTAGAILNGII